MQAFIFLGRYIDEHNSEASDNSRVPLYLHTALDTSLDNCVSLKRMR